MTEYSYTKRAMLRELSEDSRLTVTALAQRLKCSRNTVMQNMKFLEKEFDLWYTIEFDREKLGFTRNQIVTIKFGEKPKPKELKEIFAGSQSYISLLMCTEGDYDVIIKTVADSNPDYFRWSIITFTKLLKYKPTLETSVVSTTGFGFIPMANPILEKIDFTRLGLDEVDKKILLLLNENSRRSGEDISRRLGENIKTVNYRLRKLHESGIIKRYTIVMRKPPPRHHVAYFFKFAMAEGLFGRIKNAIDYYAAIDEKLPLTNTYLYSASLIGSYASFGIGSFPNQDKAANEVVMKTKELYAEDNPTIAYCKITSVLIGYLPVRNYDMDRTINEMRQGITLIRKMGIKV